MDDPSLHPGATFVLPRGGAIVGLLRNDEQTDKRRQDIIRRVTPDGSIAWERASQDSARLVLRDASSDGAVVLATRIRPSRPGIMDILILDAGGEVLAERQDVPETAWVWVDPDSKHVLRWDPAANDLIFEDVETLKTLWTWRSAIPHTAASPPGTIAPAFLANYILVWVPLDHTLQAISKAGRYVWGVRGLPDDVALPFALSSSGKSLVTVSSAEVREKAPLEIIRPSPDAVTPPASQMIARNDITSVFRIPLPPGGEGPPFPPDLVWKMAVHLETTDDLFTNDGGTIIRRRGIGDGDVLGLDIMEESVIGGVDVSFVVHRSATISVTTLRDWRFVAPASRYAIKDTQSILRLFLTSGKSLLLERSVPAGREFQLIDRNGSVAWSRVFDEEVTPVFDTARKYVAFVGQQGVSAYSIE